MVWWLETKGICDIRVLSNMKRQRNSNESLGHEKVTRYLICKLLKINIINLLSRW